MNSSTQKVKKIFKELYSQYGTQDKVAELLGYEPRTYRKIREKINTGQEINLRTQEYIVLKAQTLGINI